MKAKYWAGLDAFKLVDLDRDGDLDIVTSGKFDGGRVKVLWFENQDKGQNWVEHIIGTGY